MKAKLTLLITLLFSGLLSVFAQKAVKSGDLEHHVYEKDTIVFSKDSSIYKVENLGENINSDHVESGPRISPDGNTLYFFRIDTVYNRKKAQEFESDIYFSEYNPKDSSWSKAENIGKPLNGHGANSVQSVLADGDHLVLTNKYMKNGLTKNGISMTERKKKGKNKWTFPKTIKIRHFHNDTRYSVHMNNEGTVMILAVHDTHDKEALGQQDLYVSFKEKDGKHWTKPKNLGPKINTPKSEATAFLAKDGKTMYFSTNGRRGQGGYDIFYSERLDSTWTNWSKPKNMGVPFNTKDDEFYFSIPDKGDYAYLSHHFKTSDKLEHSDIVRIKLLEEAKPKLLVLDGFSFDKITKDTIASVVVFKDEKGNVIDSVDCSISEGYHEELPLGQKYTYEVIAKESGYKILEGEIDATGYGKYHEETLNFELERTPLLMLTMKFINKETGKPIEVPVHVEIKELPNKIVADTNANESFYVELPGGYDYELHFVANGYLPIIENKDLRDFIEYKKEEMIVEMQPLIGLEFNVKNIEFDVNKAVLRPTSFPSLDSLVRIMKDIPEIVVEIQGHTDSDGSDAANLSLSQRRAQSVVNYLVQHGISAKQFKAQGYGERQPIATNKTKEGKQKNRRVMFKVLEVNSDKYKLH
ncbi:MAG: OmpA family protein [Cytophagales bacterium]|nr:OmpA family protein [Cytophagales bacterium]